MALADADGARRARRPYAYSVLTLAASIDAVLLLQFFRKQRRGEVGLEAIATAH